MTSYSEPYNPTSDVGVDSSTTESGTAPYAPGPRSRHDSNALLTLPAPLSASRTPYSAASASSAAVSRSSDEAGVYSDVGSSSNQRLVPSPQHDQQYVDSYTEAQTPRYPQFDAHVARAGGVLRNPTISSQYPGETQNPFRSEAHVAAYDDQYGYSAEPEDMQPPPVPSKYPLGQGVSLSDHGPVPGPEGVRRVSRPSGTARRPPSQAPQNRYSRSSTLNLPPGAAAPQSGGYGSGH
jgi:chitin synthase